MGFGPFATLVTHTLDNYGGLALLVLLGSAPLACLFLHAARAVPRRPRGRHVRTRRVEVLRVHRKTVPARPYLDGCLTFRAIGELT
jgi:hypothetical protein